MNKWNSGEPSPALTSCAVALSSSSFMAGPMGGDREHVEIAQLRGFLRPERFERVCRVRPALGEKIAEAQQMTGLHRVRLIADHRFEKWYSFQEFILAIISQADVQPDSRHLRHQMFSLAQRLQSFGPLLAPHVDHAEICVSAAHLRILRPAPAGSRAPPRRAVLVQRMPGRPEKSAPGRRPCQGRGCWRAVSRFGRRLAGMQFAAAGPPPRCSCSSRPTVPIGCARLTLVLLSAVVSANLRNEFKREGCSSEICSAPRQGKACDGYDS